MDCCRFIDDHTHLAEYPSHPALNLQRQAAAAGDMLIYLFSIEASNAEYPQPGPLRPPWMELLKCLIWVAFSIAAGIVLAILCS